jgi:hypothetical protein
MTMGFEENYRIPCIRCGTDKGHHQACTLHCPNKRVRNGERFSKTWVFKAAPMPVIDGHTEEDYVRGAEGRIVSFAPKLPATAWTAIHAELHTMFDIGRRFGESKKRRRP